MLQQRAIHSYTQSLVVHTCDFKISETVCTIWIKYGLSFGLSAQHISYKQTKHLYTWLFNETAK